MRNGTISVGTGADTALKDGIAPSITPTGSTSSVVQDGLAAKSVPLSGAVVVGAVNRKVAFFNATAGALDALVGRVDTGMSGDEVLNARFVFDSDGNLKIDEDTTRSASALDQAILDDVLAPKPPAYKRFATLISQIETAHEKAGRGCVIVFSQDGTGALDVFTDSPAAADAATAAIVATDAGDTATLGNAGAPLAVVTVTAGTVSTTRLPGE